jgi:hypothetical protein
VSGAAPLIVINEDPAAPEAIGALYDNLELAGVIEAFDIEKLSTFFVR